MLSVLIGETFDLSSIPFIIASILLFLILIFILTFSRRESERFLKVDTNVFATTYDINVTYDLIVKQVEEWRRQPFKPRKLSFASLTLKVPRFAIDRNTPPRLYRIIDRYAGIITFELTSNDGGTIVKISSSPESQDLIKEFKTKLPH